MAELILMSIRSKVRSQISRLAISAVKNERYRRIVDDVIRDQEACDVILHRIGTRQWHNNDRIDEVMPAQLNDVSRFDSLLWLFSSNYANRGFSLLMLDEALWLFDTVRSLNTPKVAEIGRAQGGTTFLLAAAGARVSSIDNNALESVRRRHGGDSGMSYDEALAAALKRHGLDDRVDILVGDAITYPATPADFDVVYVDVDLSASLMIQLFDRWWPAVKPGGLLVLRDGREPRTPGVRELAGALEGRDDTEFLKEPPGVFTVVAKSARGDGTAGQEATYFSIDLHPTEIRENRP